MNYQVIYINTLDERCQTVVAVPDYIPAYDALNIEDVPLYIKAQILDLEHLEDYYELEAV